MVEEAASEGHPPVGLGLDIWEDIDLDESGYDPDSIIGDRDIVDVLVLALVIFCLAMGLIIVAYLYYTTFLPDGL